MRRVAPAPSGPPGTPSGHALDFARILLAKAEDLSFRKTERTRLRILSSIARELMAGVERTDLKVADVTRKAGLAHGTFYRYFTDMPAATAALIEAFSGFVGETLAGARDGEAGSRERVRGATLLYARLFRRNAGLMRCLLELGGDGLPFAASYQRLNRDWYGRVAAAIARRRGGATAPRDLLPAAYGLGGMIDDFLRQVYLRHEPALAHLAQDEEEIAEILTDLWCFGAYGRKE
ncbi:MAG: TetR/AcrR family transcriptional regulator [Parvibaculaceae bacterium]